MTDWNEALKTAKEGGLFIDDTERKLRASIEQSIGSTPQEEASISRLSKEMNLPRDTVQRNRAEVDNSNKYKKLDIKSILESSPQTAKYLSDPDKAKVASKDIENLSSLERGFFNNAARRVGERTTELTGQFLSFIDQSAEALNQATGIDDALGGIVFDGALPKWVGPEEFSKVMENGGNLIENASQSLKDADFGARYIHTVESVKQAFSDPDTGTLSAIGEVFLFAGEQGIASIPDMIAVVANLPGYVAARSAEIGETRAEFKGQEQTIKETLEAAPFAIGSALLERIMPTNALQNLSRESVEMVGKEVLKEAVKQGSIEGATEFIQEGAIEYVGERIGTGAEMDVAEALERGAFGALAGGPTGAVIGGTSVGARAVADRFSDARIKGNSEQAQLAAIFDSAGKSLENPDGLINVDPESFRELVRSQLEQSELSDIHISASAMTEILNQSDIDQETLGKPAFKSIEDQMLEASSVDGDIVIPIEDVLTDIMPNEQVFDSMKQWMRLSSSSMVDPEVEAETEAFQQKFQDIMAEAEENVDFKAMGLDVYNRVMEQAIASNVMPDVARKSAAVYQAAFETIGKRSGLTPEQFVERYNFGIQPATSQSESTFNQDYSGDYPLDDFDSWWGDRTYREEGGRMVSMSPDEYLNQVAPINSESELTIDNVQDLADHVASGGKLDPLVIRADGKEDGRHRALMAKQLGYSSVPVIDYRESGTSTQEINGGVSAEDFTSAITEALASNKNAASADIYPAEDYERHNLYLLDDGKAGFAITPDGTLISVFKSPDSKIKGAIDAMIPIAVQEGATRLEAFDGFLTEAYGRNGFVETERYEWDENFKPENWREEDGTPDLVVMEFDNEQYESVTSKTNPETLQELRGVRREDGAVQQPESGNRRRRNPGGGYSPLEGSPVIEGATGPDPELVSVAERYAQAAGIDLKPQSEYVEVDPERAARIAEAYDQMEHAPSDPAVKAAYRDLIDQTMAQYEALVDAGYQFYFMDPANDPYQGNPWNAMRDLRKNKVMAVYPTSDGFGSSDLDVSENPLLEDTGLKWSFGSVDGEQQTVYANDLFRAVHDAFGHGLEGAGFRARGEENAWQAHVRLFTGDAVKAITSETRGQNSWLNYGPYGEQNQTAKVEDTVFADQKTGLLPDWVFTEGLAGDAEVEGNTLFQSAVKLRSGKETLKKYGLDPGKRHNTRDVAAALEARQREKAGKIDKTDRSPEAVSKIARWMTEEVMFELEHPEKSGAGWYSYKFQRALDKFAEAFPELKTDQSSRDLMTALIAITSDGQKVVPNFAMAADYYKNFKETGTLSSSRGHQRQSSINNNVAVIQSMLESMGPEAMKDYLLQERTVSELKKIAKESGIEFSTAYKADVKMPLAAIVFGPKLGAFYANLMGAHGYLTMDRWWTRTFNRYRGTLLPKPTQQGLERFKGMLGDPEMSDDQALSETVQYKKSYEAKNYKNGTAIEKAANTIYKAAFESIEDAPFNASDRSFMLEVVERTKKNLKRRGQDISIADIQAILWYYEKRLYGDLGARQTADISYEEAAERVTGDILSNRSSGSDASGIPETAREGSQEVSEVSQGIGEEDFLSLRQSTEDNGTRGGIRFGLEDRFAQIMLDQKADSSTLMHEGAHLFLEIYSDLVMQANPPKEIEADFNNIMSWLGVDPVLWPDMSIDQKREYHERFAETFEQYMFEGKAPSPDLIPVFSAFKRWLKQLYQNIKALLPNAQINDQIRGVFDRMLATDDQIAQAEAINGYKPLFDNPAEAGMTEDEYKAYRERTSKASQKAEQTLLEKAIKQIRSLKTEWWREESEKLRPATESRLKSQRVYVAADHLKNADIKIDQAEMKEILGVEKIPKNLYGMSQKGGANPELVAQQLGYGSASEMLQDVQSSPTLSEAVKEDVERQMKERHGDILNDGTIEDEAQLAVHNPERGEAIMAEVRALTKKAGTRAGVDRKALQKRAKQVIGEKVIADINPASYHRAEVKAAAAAAAAKAKGNDADALKFKEQQAWAFYLYKEARAAKEIEAKGAKYARSLMRGGKLKKLQAAGDSYLEQAQSILGRYEFVRVSEKRLQERRSMRDWLNSILGQAHEGSPVPNHENLTEEQRQIAIEEAQQDSMGALPDVDMLDKYGVTNYREMTLDDFTGVIDALKMIDHMAGVENRLLTQSEKKKLDEWITELVETITENAQGGESARLGSNRSKSKRIAQSLKEFKDIARTPTSIVSMLDGFKDNGTAWNLIVRPLQDAAAMETENLNQASQRLKEIFGRYSSKELRSLNKNIYDTQIESNLTKHDVVSILLNWGNSQNKQRVLDGFNITEAEANYLMETYLEQKDYEFVKDVWAYLETFKKDAFDLHRDLFGFTPAEVEAEPFETRFGTMPGGYYPIKYDPVRSAAAEQHLAEKQSEAFVKSIKSRNKLGSNQARAATVKRAINTDMSQVIFGHINDVIHQTTHDRALYDVGRILANDRVKAAINEHQGEQFYKSLTSMVRNIKDGTEPTKDIMDRVVQVVRNNATLAMLGASLRTIVLQPFGITNSIAQARMSGLGASGLINGYARYMKDPASNAGMIREKSLYMKNREQTQSVAISRIKNKIRDGSRVDVIRESVMIPMMKVQFYSVDAPLWMATYEKALQSMDEDAAIKTADQAVRAAQGGGNIVDTAEAMMGGPFRKLFTNFLTYSVTTYNLQAQNFRRTFKLGEQGVFDFAVNTFVLMTMPAILTAMLNDWIAGDDDDEDLAERIAREQASFLMSVNPLTAQFSGAATGFDYSGPQGSAIISKTLQLSTQVGQGEADDAAIKSGIWVAGLLTGLPAAQINRTVFGIKGAMEDNESAGTTIKQALFGPER